MRILPVIFSTLALRADPVWESNQVAACPEGRKSWALAAPARSEASSMHGGLRGGNWQLAEKLFACSRKLMRFPSLWLYSADFLPDVLCTSYELHPHCKLCRECFNRSEMGQELAVCC